MKLAREPSLGPPDAFPQDDSCGNRRGKDQESLARGTMNIGVRRFRHDQKLFMAAISADEWLSFGDGAATHPVGTSERVPIEVSNVQTLLNPTSPGDTPGFVRLRNTIRCRHSSWVGGAKSGASRW